MPDDGAAFEEARLCLIRRYLELKGKRDLAPELSARCPGSANATSRPGP
ncbi:hypothetical protein [Corallococcus exiguus]|uniref:Uncharacterized protein n=1 Tax=Corallococcus exiguus TaxID=83462 RepID=A0A7X4YFE4_9BACT|nr:hypothetical protein [Corallococcus exiguus]NBC44433.1 hypothetical protein [Corallococcus exiguus]